MRRWLSALLVVFIFVTAAALWSVLVQEKVIDQACTTSALKNTRLCWQYLFEKAYEEERRHD